MHSDRVSVHAIVWRVSRQYGPKVHVLVWHGSHSHAMASWSSSKLAHVVEGVRGADITMARTGRYGRADGRVHGSRDG
jgi:predicted neutral ceramidase superfamily lipid hydrolase